ncbi:hypothetical protein C1H46_003894 [Malus baccata]|uniref:Proton pump-interactor 1 n=1 Tax=Malus baccata TaxID=106549 RepID=A0A540NHF6_MALBA|nr:hypothetical protein C1H46_003894 [Malus baccata]
MGVEVVGFEVIQGPVGAVTEGGNSAKENGKLDQGPGGNEPIQFGSHGDESDKKEVNEVSVPNFPKDAVDEWPAPKQIHSFYFVRHRTIDDPKIKARIDHASKEVNERNKARQDIIEALRAKRMIEFQKTERSELIEKIKALRNDNRQIRSIVDEKFKDLQPLRQALGEIRSADTASRSGGLCSSEEELNSRIQGLQYYMQHESIPLSEEKKILKEMKALENTRGQVIAREAELAKLLPKEALKDQVKLMDGDLKEVKKEQDGVRAKIKHLDDAVKVIDKAIASLQEDLDIVTEKRDKAFENIRQLRLQTDQANAGFYHSRGVMTKARNLAATNNVKALEALSNEEVEKFMSLWNSNKDFRDDYEKRILPSLDSRQMSRDGRIRNPDEKPLVVVEAPVVETAPKSNAKQVKEDTRSALPDTSTAQKVQKEAKNKATAPKSVADHIDMADEEIFVSEKEILKENKIDPAKLKEMKREEEIEKNKLALERKKKKAEKDAAKAAIRAQKEAEKKLKEREKKAKKKSSSAPDTNPEELIEPVAEVAEPEKVTEKVEAPVPAKARAQKDNSVRNRGRARGSDALPKAILKRKKSSTNYWLWAAPAAVLVVLFLVLGYYYLH